MSCSIERHRLIVGVDYGTTFSGIAFGDTVNDAVRALAQYPGREPNWQDEKTPSEVAYDTKAPNGYYIGRQIRPGAPRQRWTKLLLDEEYENDMDANTPEDNSLMFDSHLNQPLPPGKDACDVVADYLTVFHDHAMEKLELDITAEVLKTTPIDWVLTVPAVWSDRAMSLTLEAAAQAGIGQRQGDTISMVSEPEAAAICAIRELQQKRTQFGSPFKVGEHILICDAGGGTVDLITYQIVQIEPTLRITESVVGSGAKCGSVFIDQEFHKLLRSKIGDTRYNSINERKMSVLMKEFETLKRSYGSSSFEEDTHYLPLPGFEDDPDAGLEMDDFLLENDDMRICFDHVVNQIINLVQGQIGKVQDQGGEVKNIILVGGFGQSKYLLNALQSQNWPLHPRIEVIQPQGAWSAISRGAVLKQKHGSLVLERKCRRSYGTRANTVFDPQKHAQEDAFMSTDTGLKMARNQVSWIITKGSSTDGSSRYSLKCSTTFQKGEYPRRRGTTLVACDSDTPPSSYNDPKVYDVCFLMADLSAVPEQDFEEHVIGNMTFLMAEFTIELAKDSAELQFELCYKGTSYGSVKTTYR